MPQAFTRDTQRKFDNMFTRSQSAGCGVTNGGMCDPSPSRYDGSPDMPLPSIITNKARMIELVNQK